MPTPPTETYELSRELEATTLPRVGILRINQVMVLDTTDDAILRREFRVTFEAAGADARTMLVEGTDEAVARGAYRAAEGLIAALEAKRNARAARKAEAADA